MTTSARLPPGRVHAPASTRVAWSAPCQACASHALVPLSLVSQRSFSSSHCAAAADDDRASLLLASSYPGRYLQPAIAVVLGFIGVNLIGECGGIEVPTVSSLLFVLGVLGTGVGASILEATADGEVGETDESDGKA